MTCFWAAVSEPVLGIAVPAQGGLAIDARILSSSTLWERSGPHRRTRTVGLHPAAELGTPIRFAADWPETRTRPPALVTALWQPVRQLAVKMG